MGMGVMAYLSDGRGPLVRAWRCVLGCTERERRQRRSGRGEGVYMVSAIMYRRRNGRRACGRDKEAFLLVRLDVRRVATVVTPRSGPG
jgi:hypothetical protein